MTQRQTPPRHTNLRTHSHTQPHIHYSTHYTLVTANRYLLPSIQAMSASTKHANMLLAQCRRTPQWVVFRGLHSIVQATPLPPGEASNPAVATTAAVQLDRCYCYSSKVPPGGGQAPCAEEL